MRKPLKFLTKGLGICKALAPVPCGVSHCGHPVLEHPGPVGGDMFRRVLLCYDGSAAGRKALKRGAELAKLSKAEVYVLSVFSEAAHSAAVWAVAAGSTCLVDPAADDEISAREANRYMKELGVDAQVLHAHGNVIDEIAACAQKISADLVVVGHYPKPSGGRWWSGSDRGALAERVNCCILIAVSDQ